MRLFSNENYIPIVEACIIGLVAGCSAVLLSSGINWISSLRIHLSHMASPAIVFPLFGLIGGLIAGILVDKVAPEASGSGIPQVKARLERLIVPLDFRVALVKLLGSIVALGSGFFLGREGPTVQLGAAVAAPLSKLLPTTATHKRQLIAAGAGAGLAAAFNAPLAGVVFVLEELLKEIRPSTIVLATVACAASALILNIFRLPHFHTIVAPLANTISFHATDLPFLVLLGIVSGVFGALFNDCVVRSLNFYRDKIKVSVAIKVGIAGLITGIILACKSGPFHNATGIQELIVTGGVDWQSVLLLSLESFLLTLVAYGSGAPGGLFAPSLVLGSCIGYIIGFTDYIFTGATSSAATFALIGMGGFFSAVGRVPLTAIVITFELTTNFKLLTPLMLVCVLSSVVGELISKGSLYDRLMRWNGIHLQGPEPTDSLRSLKTKDVMHEQIDSVKSSTPIKDILNILGTTAQRGLPVTEKGNLIGVITQTDLSKVSLVESNEDICALDIMTPYPVAVSPYDSLDEILTLFTQHKFTWLPVVYHDKLKGIILQSDVLASLFNQNPNPFKHIDTIDNKSSEKNTNED